MTARILIIDSAATQRIVLKVKLLAAHYDVTAVASQREAEAVIASDARPDLILIDLGDQSEDRFGFCRALSDTIATQDIALLGMGPMAGEKARLAALEAGVKDVLMHPVDEAFLLARVRSLLRFKNQHSEIWIRDAAGRALGFEEERSSYACAPQVHLLTESTGFFPEFIRSTAVLYAPNAQILPIDRHVPLTEPHVPPDLFVIDATLMADPHETLFRLTADLRSRHGTRLAAQLVVVAPGALDVAATALDLGADDVVTGDISEGEMQMRCQILLAEKQKRDKFHANVKDGLLAAITDPLTGLYNRRYADPYLDALVSQADGSNQNFAVMMIDIDHFKSVNDTYGHAVGDAVLVTLADRLRANLRGIDLIARVGGEEFLVALPQASREMAEMTADRLRAVVNETPFRVAGLVEPLLITVSIGVAMGRPEQEADVPDLETTRLMADGALYAAKSAGRNQVSFAA